MLSIATELIHHLLSFFFPLNHSLSGPFDLGHHSLNLQLQIEVARPQGLDLLLLLLDEGVLLVEFGLELEVVFLEGLVETGELVLVLLKIS